MLGVKLSEAQRRVKELQQMGCSPKEIARRMRTTVGVVNAQLTRIRNKGLAEFSAMSQIADEDDDDADVLNREDYDDGDDEDTDVLNREDYDDEGDEDDVDDFGSGLETPQPVAEFLSPQRDTRSEFDVIDEAVAAGPAVYNVDQAIDRLKSTFGPQAAMNDTHPMVLLGVTIQYMKLAGGRIAAHQLIEDVYVALRGMVSGGFQGEADWMESGSPQKTPPKQPELAEVLTMLHQQLQRMGT